MDTAQLQSILKPLQLEAGELTQFAAALRCPPRPAIRLRSGLDPAVLPFTAEQVRWHPQGYFVSPDIRPAACVNYGAGDYYIQDAASLLAVAALAARPGERVCDLCAAPGGKATAILDAIQDDGWLLANETIQSRLAPLRLQLARHGVPRYLISQQDPEELADRLGSAFDAVLVDAPCTGQSLLGRGKQTESAFSRQAIEHCAARQERILSAAARLVRPGGRLVYSTCTYSYQENEGQVASLLRQRGGWTLEPQPHLQPWSSALQPACYRLWPHRDASGGAFAAVLRRADETTSPGLFVGGHKSQPLPTAIAAELAEWGSLQRAFCRAARDRCFAWPEAPPGDLLDLAGEGPELAFRKGHTWFPAYALAMRRDDRWSPRAVATLNDADAAAYLAGQVVPCSLPGWVVANWQGRPLGWVKGDGRRAKNHLPKPARLAAVAR